MRDSDRCDLVKRVQKIRKVLTEKNKHNFCLFRSFCTNQTCRGRKHTIQNN